MTEVTVGEKYGYLEVLEVITHRRGSGLRCRCVCQKVLHMEANVWRRRQNKSCGCKRKAIRGPREDLVGRRFGSLVVLAAERLFEKNRSSYELVCQCDCGRKITQPKDRLVSGKVVRCVYCRDHTFHTGKHHYRYAGVGDMPGLVWSHLKGGAIERNIAVTVTKEELWNVYVKQEGRCSLTGLEIGFGRKHFRENSASVDRIDSSLPYSLDNVQWVHKDVNLIKWTFPVQYFKHLCRLLVNRAVSPVGEAYGLWQVFGTVHDSEQSRVGYFAKCRCGKCSVISLEEEVAFLGCVSVSCGCMSRGFLEFSQATLCGYSAKKKKYRGSIELPHYNWHLIVRGASARAGKPYAVSITKDYVSEMFKRQDGRCALSGVKLFFPTPANGQTRIASLDRINNDLGYVEGNVQWLHKDVNRLKNRFLLSRVMEICRLVTERSPRHMSKSNDARRGDSIVNHIRETYA